MNKESILIDFGYVAMQLRLISEHTTCPIARDCARRAMDGLERIEYALLGDTQEMPAAATAGVPHA